MNIAVSELLLFCLAVIGLVHIIIDGSIFQSLRDLGDKILPAKITELYKCYQCCGFWCGAFIGLFMFGVYHAWPITVFLTFVCGWAGSFISTSGTIFMNVLEAKMVMLNYTTQEEADNGG